MLPGPNKRAEAGSILEFYRQRIDLFTLLATLCVMALYSAPLVLSMRLALEPSVAYWGGQFPVAVFAVPVLILIAHLIYVCVGRPIFEVGACTLMLPAMLLIILGFWTSVTFVTTIDDLRSTDCSGGEKAKLQDAWELAATSYDDCLERVASTTHESIDAVAAVVRFDDCEEYTDSKGSDKFHSQWKYLKRLEHMEVCAGWCAPGGKPLFVEDDVPRGICSEAAGDSLDGYARRLGLQLSILGFASLVAGGIFLGASKERVVVVK